MATRIKRNEQLVLSVSGLVFAASLGLFAWAGFSTRYWADDYCYGAWVRFYGLPGAVLDWYQTSGNRLSTLVAVALGESFGMNAIRWVPLTVLALMVAAWVMCLGQLARLAGLDSTAPGSRVWLALVQVYFLVLLAPDRLQTIYWRMGTLHYTLPLALLLFNLALLVWAWRRLDRWLWPVVGLSGLLAFFAAGFSETYAALQAGVYGTMLLAAAWMGWASLRSAPAKSRSPFRLLPLTGAPLAGTLLMMAVMALAPANAWRQAVMPPPDNLLLVIPYALRYALDFIIASLASRPVPYAVYGLGMAALAILLCGAGQLPRLQPKTAGFGLAISLLATYGLVVCSFAPSAYAGLLYPAARAQMPAAFILLAGLGAAAGLGAVLLAGLVQRGTQRLAPVRGARMAGGVALLLLAAISLYPLRQASIPLNERAGLAARAERWDTRDAQIRAALAAGVREVRVQQVDVVQSLEDLAPEPSNWINACAALYYQASSISAFP